MKMKKIALLNSVYRGGKTYLEYLKNILPYLLEINTPPRKNYAK